MEGPLDSQVVLVTGASGYIATHIVKQLLEGGYRVRGTVRNLKDENKIKNLKNICPSAKHELELVEADLLKPETWKPAVQGAKFVIHVASPFPGDDPADESVLIKPAVEGATSVLKACVASGTVKRVVLTSSTAAVLWAKDHKEGEMFTENDWSWTDHPQIGAYEKSKTLAERAAWDFIENLADEQKIELTAINPCVTLGPIINGSVGASVNIVKQMLDGSIPMAPKIKLSVVDVRDVATAHIKAMTLPEAAGKRFVLSSANLFMIEMCQKINEELNSQGYYAPTREIPNFLLQFAAYFSAKAARIASFIGKVKIMDNSRMKNILGIEPRDVKETLVDTAYSVIEAGIVKKTAQYTGPPHSQ